MATRWRVVVAFAIITSVGCFSGGDPLVGLIRGAEGDGPRVTWDLFAEPLPEVPFPNDVATRVDVNSPTGLRVNASREAPTSFERRLRDHIAQLDGFGTFAPVWIQFESPDPARPELGRLDLLRLRDRQRGDTAFEDDAVLLINVTPDSPTYGEATVLDFGNGNFPIVLEDEDDFFTHDPRKCASNLVFDTYEEDANGNGVFDPGEDTDNDGVFDHPNMWGTVDPDIDMSTYDPCASDFRDHHELISFYELETNTLWFRPVFPLQERTTYAVVLTRDLVGENGDPIQSPFEYAHHLAQRGALTPLFNDGLLEKFGRTADDVAFAWSFTTQSVTEGLVSIREGLYGYGPFAHLEETYPPVIEAVVPMTEEPGIEEFLLRPEKLTNILQPILDNLDIGLGDAGIGGVVDTFGAIDYIVAGDYVSPDFLEPSDGIFDLDPVTGKAPNTPTSLRYLMVIPKKTYGTAPFPTVLYCHGYTSMKLEGVVFAGVLARYGLATFVIDSYSHGLPLGPEYDDIIQSILTEFGGEGLLPFYDAIKKDRARDLNNDTFVEVGGDFWTNDMFHTRDMVRQTVVDYIQAIRVIRGFDGEALWDVDMNGDGLRNDIAGDFNADGVPDLGGPDNPFYAMGTSMGGINSTILGAFEPAVRAAAPISPGGGLLEVGLRTDLGNVTRAAILPMLGPMVITRPNQGNSELMNVEFMVNDVFTLRQVLFARVGEMQGGQVVNALQPGDLFTVRNLRNGEEDVVVVDDQRRVWAHIAADKEDPVEIVIRRPDGTLVKRIDTFEFFEENGKAIEAFQGRPYVAGEPLTSIQEGLGFRRNTPSLRRLVGLAQMILEPGDPVNYGVKYAEPIAVRPDGISPTNVLLTVTLGDMTVPISSGIALARATGVIDYKNIDPVYGVSQNQLLIDQHVVEAVDKLRYFKDDFCHYDARDYNFDIDDLSDGRHPNDLPNLRKVTRPPICQEANPPAECSMPCPELPPLRATRVTENGIRAVRFPALSPHGQHAIFLPDEDLAFDPSMFVLQQIGLFLGSGGEILSDHPCLATADCTTCVGEPDCPVLPPQSFLNAGLD